MSSAIRMQDRPEAADTVLTVNNIEVVYDHVILVLKGVSLNVPKGGIVALLGANGAGKTTTMRLCLGILRADAGEIRWDGQPVDELPRQTWGYLPEERGLYPRMPVLDQLVYFATLYGQPADHARDEARRWLARFRIPEYATRRAEELSKGNQQKVQFIAAILHGPDVLLIERATDSSPHSGQPAFPGGRPSPRTGTPRPPRSVRRPRRPASTRPGSRCWSSCRRCGCPAGSSSDP